MDLAAYDATLVSLVVAARDTAKRRIFEDVHAAVITEIDRRERFVKLQEQRAVVFVVLQPRRCAEDARIASNRCAQCFGLCRWRLRRGTELWSNGQRRRR
mgnify:CR=1 FL=1